jgi:hypothetical protein
LLRNTLKFLALSLVIIALASPITTKEVILDNSKGYEISLILDNSAPVPCAISLKIPALNSPALPMPMVYTFILLLLLFHY